MENESTVVLQFLSPEWLVLFSLVSYFLLRKPFQTIFGPLNVRKDLVNGFIIFIQLLLVNVVLDFVSRVLSVNDTQSVNAAVQVIFSQGILGAVNVVFSAFAEEVFFRGILFSALGSIPTILLFGAAHAGYGSFVELLGALAAGFILVRAREQYKSIFPGLIGHALYNLVIVFVLFHW